MDKFKVLIPLDGSAYAEHALAFLPQMLSRIGDLDLTLLSVVDTRISAPTSNLRAIASRNSSKLTWPVSQR